MFTAGTGAQSGSTRVAVFLAIAVVLWGALLAIAPAGRAEAAPVGCTSDFYVATNSTSITDRAADGTTATINTGTLGALTIAFDPIDGYLYALSNSAATGNHLFRVEADGSNTDLGAITGLPGSATFPAMTFGSDGTLWIANGSVYRADITTMTATVAGTGISGDIAFVGGELYGWAPGHIVHFNTTTGTTTSATVAGLGTVGGMWSSSGHLYVGQGTDIREVIGYDTATPTLTTVATLPATAGDGASCATAPSPFLAAIDDDYTGAPISANAGGTTASVFTNDRAAGAAIAAVNVTPTLQSDGGLTGAALAADGTVSVPAGTTAGAYTLGYQICLVSAPTVCDPASVTLVVQAAAVSPAKPSLAATGADPAPGSIAAGSLILVGLLALALRAAQRRRQQRRTS